MKKKILFPSQFKFIGVFLVLIPVILHLLQIELISNNSNLSKTILETIVCIGLYLIVFSKYKDDDEMLYAIRLKSIAYSIIFGIFLLISTPLVYLFLWNQETTDESAGGIIMSVLFFNMIIFFNERRRLKDDLNNEE